MRVIDRFDSDIKESKYYYHQISLSLYTIFLLLGIEFELLISKKTSKQILYTITKAGEDIYNASRR